MRARNPGLSRLSVSTRKRSCWAGSSGPSQQAQRHSLDTEFLVAQGDTKAEASVGGRTGWTEEVVSKVRHLPWRVKPNRGIGADSTRFAPPGQAEPRPPEGYRPKRCPRN